MMDMTHSMIPPISDIGRIYRHRIMIVIGKAAELMDVTAGEIVAHSRQKHFFRARCLVVWTLRNFRKDLSYNQIARHLGGLNHTSVVHQFQSAEALLQTDIEFAWACYAMAIFIHTGDA
jgi:chromosomal replication initiation ATPase DnaA